MGLTKKKRAFIQAYCDDPKVGQAEAARKAGCSLGRAKQTAHDWMRDPEVKREIDRQLANKFAGMEQKVKSKELSRESVIQSLNDIEEMCNLAGPGAWQVTALLKVAELRGKILKLFTERIEFGLDEKLIARLEAGRRNAGIAPQLAAGLTIEAKGDEQEPESIPDPDEGAPIQ